MAPRFRNLDFRTIDGSGNNVADPSMNQTGTDFGRVGPANFADGFNSMTPGLILVRLARLIRKSAPERLASVV